MAEVNKNTVEKKKTVKIKLPLIRGEEESKFVSVNGENFLIKRGIEVEVPDYVALVLQMSEKAEYEAEEYIRQNMKGE